MKNDPVRQKIIDNGSVSASLFRNIVGVRLFESRGMRLAISKVVNLNIPDVEIKVLVVTKCSCADNRSCIRSVRL